MINLSAISATSTNMNTKYLRSKYVSYETINIKGQQVTVIDTFNPTYTKICKNLQPTNAFIYNGQQHITTIAYLAFLNTSCYWLLLLMNAAMHPLLPAEVGTPFLLPNIDAAVANASIANSPATSGVQTTII